MAQERLQKILARAGIASRRAAEELIVQGRVTVNGKKATLGMSADAEHDDIRLDAEPIKLPEFLDYYILNKPRGVIADEDVAREHPSARELIPVGGHLYPVGRLDLGSEGLMLFTNDGALAHRLTHPRYDHPKTYEVLVEGNVSEATLDQWRKGVLIEGKRTRPAEVTKLKRTRSGTLLEITMREGRKRQIRKVAALLGHPVAHLVRTRLGPLTLKDLPSGAWRRLTPEEVAALRAVRESPEPRRPRAASRMGARPASAGAGRSPRGAGGPSRHPASTRRSGSDERSGRREQREERPPRRWGPRDEEATNERSGRPRPEGSRDRAGGSRGSRPSDTAERRERTRPESARPGAGQRSERSGGSGPKRRDDDDRKDADRGQNRPGGSRPGRARPGTDRSDRANRPERPRGSGGRPSAPGSGRSGPRRPSTGNKPKRGSDRS